MRLKFQALQEAHSLVVGPAAQFRVAGNFIREEPGERAIAEYVRHQWRVGERCFSRYDCLDPCSVRFEDADRSPSQIFGPFAKLWAADGAVYGDARLVAKFTEETLLWHSLDLESYWPNLLILPAHARVASA